MELIKVRTNTMRLHVAVIEPNSDLLWDHLDRDFLSTFQRNVMCTIL